MSGYRGHGTSRTIQTGDKGADKKLHSINDASIHVTPLSVFIDD